MDLIEATTYSKRKEMKIVKFLAFICLILGCTFTSFAGKVSLKTYLDKANIVPGKKIGQEAYEIKNGSTASANASRNNLVTLSYNRKNRSDNLNDYEWRYLVSYKIYSKQTPSQFYSYSVEVKFSETDAVYEDVSTINITFQDPEIEITSIQAWYSTDGWTNTNVISNPWASDLIPDDIHIELHTITERFIYLNPNSRPKVKFKPVDNTVNWTYVLGAEEYELEYVFIDDKENIGAFGSTDYEGPFDYKRATRIHTTHNHFELDMVYPKGTLYFRVRAVGRYIQNVSNDYTHIKYSEWGYNQQGNTSSAAEKYAVTSTFFSALNWQIVSTFAEGGKHKNVITYADGTTRSRQVQTNLSTDKATLVAETKYDHEGRPAVQIIPAPKANNDLDYLSLFNVDNSNGEFNKTDFDQSIHNPLGSPSSGTYGPGQYYSSNNQFTNNLFNDFIPKGDGYTYTRTEYLRDNTGKVRRQSGLGEIFKTGDNLGEEREIENYYGTPTSTELHRMFGTNVGKASHYKKMMTVDANEVVTITYQDQEGRTIATCMAGDEPDNLHPAYSGAFPVWTMNFNDNNVYNEGSRTWISSNKILNSLLNYTYTFHYDMLGDIMSMSQLSFCADCEYDLEITITDPDGKPQYVTYNSASITKITAHFDDGLVTTSCGPTTYTPTPANIDFTSYFTKLGEYTVTKKLKLATDDLEAKIEAAVNQMYPPSVLANLITEYQNAVDLSPCDTNSYEEDLDTYTDAELTAFTVEMAENECEAVRSGLLSDLYTIYDPVGGSWSLPIDALPGASSFWSTVNSEITAGNILLYYNYDGNGNGIGSAAVSGGVQTAVTNGDYRFEWAEILLPYHPGYCHYTFCNNFKDSKAYDMRMALRDYATANTDGYKTPLSSPNEDPFLDILDNTYSSTYKNTFTNIINNYPGGTGTTDLWNFLHNNSALYANIGASFDNTWNLFRMVYQHEKLKLIDQIKSDQSCSYDNATYLEPYEFAEDQGDLDELFANDPMYDPDLGKTELCSANVDRWIIDLKELHCTHLSDPEESLLYGYLYNYCNNNLDGKNPLGIILDTDVSGSPPLSDPDLEDARALLDGLTPPCDIQDISVSSPYQYTTFKTISVNQLHASCNQKFIDFWNNYMGPTMVSNKVGASWQHANWCAYLGDHTTEFVPSTDPFYQCLDAMFGLGGADIWVAATDGHGTNGHSIQIFDHNNFCSGPPPLCEFSILAEGSNMLAESLMMVTPFPNTGGTYMINYLGARDGSWVEAYTFQSTMACFYSEVIRDTTIITGLDQPTEFDDPCDSLLLAEAKMRAHIEFERLRNAFRDDFLKEYFDQCDDPQENFYATYKDNTYNYTLYYYDQAGNLTRTVPPEGVNRLDVSAFNATTGEYNGYSLPQHDFKTTYRYTSLNQPYYQETPDAGISNFYFNKKGQLRFSQSAQQFSDGNFSYSHYDNLGRIIESGENTVNICDGTSTYSVVLEDQVEYNFPYSYQSWDATYTYYDGNVTSPLAGNLGVAHMKMGSVNHGTYMTLGPENTRNRISNVYYVKGEKKTQTDCYPSSPISIDYHAATHYSYDPHGNVKTLVQEFGPAVYFNNSGSGYYADDYVYKRISYKYDLISGNVKLLTVQDGQNDQFMHRYEYDADNRINRVYTSNQGYIWDLDAEYFYYLHGPLARIEIGEDKVQGTDNAYTLQGWLKGLNSSSMIPSRDMGQDGNLVASNLNRYGARDVYAYSMGYYNRNINHGTTVVRDYIPISGWNLATNYFAQPEIGSLGDIHNNDKHQLYNGNIGNINVVLTNENESALTPVSYGYEYDQLNRLRKMDYFENSSLDGTNSLSLLTVSSFYDAEYTYDGNGNIKTLKRNGNLSGGSTTMDNLTYVYTTGTPKNNKLLHVTDAVGDAVYTDIDLDGQSSGNYDYDDDGNLTQDLSEEIHNIIWTPSGKIQEIQRVGVRSGTGTCIDCDDPELEFRYDGLGNRILKIVKPRNGSGGLVSQRDWVYTYYLRDASGQVMSIYERTFAAHESEASQYVSTWNRIESPIYGSSRVGVNTSTIQTLKQEFKSTIINGLFDEFNPAFVITRPGDWNNYTDAIALNGGTVVVTPDYGPTEEMPANWAFWVYSNDVIDVQSDGDYVNVYGTIYNPTVNVTRLADNHVQIPANTAVEISFTGLTKTDEIDITGNGGFAIRDDLNASQFTFKNDGVFEYWPWWYPPWLANTHYKRIINDKVYELSNHLGNVMQTIAPRKMVENDNGSAQANWQAYNGGSFSINGADCDITVAADEDGAVLDLSTTIGKEYTLLFELDPGTTDVTFDIRESVDGSIKFNQVIDMAADHHRIDFIATQTTMHVHFYVTAAYNPSQTFTVTNAYLRTKDDDYYMADVKSYSDYYPFGMQIPGRIGSANDYRYGFNGMEEDDEVKGDGNSNTTQYRIYDSRIARWTSIDPMSAQEAGWTPFRINFNNPLRYIDPNGAYEIKAKLSRADRQSIRQNFKGNARKEQRSKLVEQRENSIRKSVEIAKNLVDNDERVRDAFIKFSGVKPGSKKWNQLWTEGTGGPTIHFMQDFDSESVSAFTYDNGKIELNGSLDLSKAAITILHEYVHYGDLGRANPYDGTKDGIPGVDPELQRIGIETIMRAAFIKYAGTGNDKGTLQGWLDHYGPHSTYPVLDETGKAVGVELGYAFEMSAFGKVNITNKDYMMTVAKSYKPVITRGGDK